MGTVLTRQKQLFTPINAMLNAGTIQATAEVNMRRFSQGMKQMHREGDRASKQVRGSLDGIGRKLVSISALAKSAFAVAMVRGARSAINEFALLEGSLAKFEVVFGDQANETERWVNIIRERVPLANREIIASAAAMQDLLVPMGIAREQATGMTREWIELAAALAAFNDVPVDQALEAIRSGIAGQSRPLRAFGIDVRETALQQTALEEGLIASGQAMDETARQQALLIQAYRQSQDAIDGYEDQLGSTLIMEQNLGATYKDTIAIIGADLDPAYKDLIGTLTDMLVVYQELHKELKIVIEESENLASVSKTVADTIFPAGRATRWLRGQLTDLWGEMVETVKYGRQVRNMLLSIPDQMNRNASATEESAKELRDWNAEALQTVESIRGLREQVDAVTYDNVIPPIKEITDFEHAMDMLSDSIQDFDFDSSEFFDTGSIAAMRQEVEQLNHALERTTDPEKARELQAQIEGLETAIQQMRFGIQDAGDDLEKATGAAQFFSRTLADGLDQVLFRARSVEDAIKGIIRQLASRALTTGLMALLGGGLGGVSFGRAMFGGTFHTGGVVPGVGEKMINVQGGEAVLTKDQVKSLGSSSTQRIELTVNVRGGTQLSGKDLRYVIDEQVRQSVRLQ